MANAAIRDSPAEAPPGARITTSTGAGWPCPARMTFLNAGAALRRRARPRPHQTRQLAHESVRRGNRRRMMASVPGRYASAPFELAKDQGQLPAIEQDLRISRRCSTRARTHAHGAQPCYRRRRAASRTRRGVEEGRHRRPRRQLLPAHHQEPAAFRGRRHDPRLQQLAARERGEVTAEVASAHPLGEAHIAELKETLRASVGKDVQLNTRVDPSLLGGLIVKIGSRMIDNSLRTKLLT